MAVQSIFWTPQYISNVQTWSLHLQLPYIVSTTKINSKKNAAIPFGNTDEENL